MQNKLIYAIVVVSMILGLSSFTRGHDWGDDFASYIAQAQSLSSGSIQNFMEHNVFTVNESFGYIGPTAYPWGYPLLLVPAYLLRGIHPIVLKLPGLTLFVTFLICLYVWMKNRFTLTESLVLVSLFAFNPLLIGFLDQILSDIPFLFFSTLALLFISNNKRFDVKNALLIGLSIGFAFFIRKQGILILAGYLAAQALDLWIARNDKEHVKNVIRHASFTSITFILIWIITALAFPGEGESYFAQYNEFQAKTVIEFTWRYATLFGTFFGSHWAWQAIYWITVVFFLIGAWTKWREEKSLILFFIIWMLFLITWPFWQGERFIFPLLPIVIYFTFTGMKAVIAKTPSAYQQTGITVFHTFWAAVSTIFLLTSGMNAYVNLQDNRDIAGPFDAYSDEMFNFIRDDTPLDSVVIFFKPRAMSLFTGRYSIRIDECGGLSKGNYVSIHKKWDNSQIPPDEIDECSIPLKSVFENRRFIVYQVLK